MGRREWEARLTAFARGKRLRDTGRTERGLRCAACGSPRARNLHIFRDRNTGVDYGIAMYCRATLRSMGLVENGNQQR